MKNMAKIMQECWYENPSARLTSLRVKKSLGRMYDDCSAQKCKDEVMLPDKKTMYVSLENGKGYMSTATSGVES